MADALDACPGAAALAAQLRVNAADPAWELFDDQAAMQARLQQGSDGLQGAAEDFHQQKLIGEQLAGQQLAGRIARLANPELQAIAEKSNQPFSFLAADKAKANADRSLALYGKYKEAIQKR